MNKVEDIQRILDIERGIAETEVSSSASPACSAPTDSDRLDWLESMAVEVRTPLRHGSRALFHAQTVSEDYEQHRTSLRDQIDAAMKA